MKLTDDYPLVNDNHLSRSDLLKIGYERDALLKARARQDKSYTKFDRWIAAAIAELAAE